MALNRVVITNIRRYKMGTGSMYLKDGDKNGIHLCDAEYGKIYYYRRRMNECYFVKLHSVHKNGRNRDEYEMTVYKFLCGNEKTQENKERVDILLSMFYNGMLIEDLVAFQKL